MGNTFYFAWEVSLMTFLQSSLSPALINIISFFSMFGEQLVCVGVLGFLYWCYDKSVAEDFGLGVIAANTVCPMIKCVALRRRPYFDNPSIKCFRQVSSEGDLYDIAAQGYSFPSGHSATATSVYSALPLFFSRRWVRVIAWVLPLLVGFSRVVVGAHYPTDVLCGWALGLVTVFGLSALRKHISRAHLRLIVLLVTAAGCLYCTSNDYFTSFGMLLGFVIAVPFEKRFVNFETLKFDSRRSYLIALIRIALGGICYLVLSDGLKMVFNMIFTDPGNAVRVLRYAVVTFVCIAVYPLCFKPLRLQ